MSRLVEANEPDIINYQFYLNKDETKCIANETYTDSEAALAHNNSVASRTILPKIFSLTNLLDSVVDSDGQILCHWKFSVSPRDEILASCSSREKVKAM